MKRAIFSVASRNRLGNIKILMHSAKMHYPDFDRIVYLLDGDMDYVEEGCRYYQAATLFPREGFLHDAFAYPEHEFEIVVAIKALPQLFAKGYDAIIICEWGTEFLHTDASFRAKDIPADSVTFVVDGLERPSYTVTPSYLINETSLFYSPIWMLTAGNKTDAFLGFCLDKIELLASWQIKSSKAIGYDELPIHDQPRFYETWYNYARVFDLQIHFKDSDNLSLGFNRLRASTKYLSFTPLIRYFESFPDRNFYFKKMRDENLSEGDYLAQKKSERLPPLVLKLYEDYVARAATTAEGQEEKYRFAFFDDGTPIIDAMRVYFAYNYRMAEVCRNPFAEKGRMLASNAISGDSNLLLYTAVMDILYLDRPDVRAEYPHPFTENRLAYLHWFLEYGYREAGIPTEYVQPVQESLDEYRKWLASSNGQIGSLRRLTNKLRRTITKEPAPLAPMCCQNEKPLPGVNLCTFIRGDFGISEAGRMMAASFEAAGIPFTIVNYQPANNFEHTNTNHSWDHKISNQFIYNTNIFLFNAPATKLFQETIAPEALENRYNIGCWYWETPEFPKKWHYVFDLVDEVWTSSEFTADAFRACTDKPVHVVPCSVEVEDTAPLSRTDFGIREDAFVFLMMYDSRSSDERKNPIGSQKAFLSKYAGNPNVQLVIKISANPNWELAGDEFAMVSNAYDNVKLLVGTYSREKVNALVGCCDAFVSLHRSEGFGLGPAEAMYLGKPVVLTNWSGNTQYMTADNCCPVRCDIVEVTDGGTTYEIGSHWAEPDIAQAAEYMQRLVEDTEYYKSIAVAGQKTIRENFNSKTVGEIAKDRLMRLNRL